VGPVNGGESQCLQAFFIFSERFDSFLLSR
jgi:hypothetical protein